MTTLAINVHDLHKSFGPRVVIDGLTMHWQEGSRAWTMCSSTC